MSDSIQVANENIQKIDRKLTILNIPIIISILIALGLSVDGVRRLFESFNLENAQRDDRNNAANFYTDLNSFLDSDNSAGFMVGLEDELSTVVTFEPKYPELRESMEVLFDDFNQNISDWDINEIPYVDVFKIRISALTANLDAVSDENLMDVLRLVRDEIDKFRIQTEVWANSIPIFNIGSLEAFLEMLGGILLVLTTTLVVAKRKNTLVHERYKSMQVKVNAIAQETKSREVPLVLNTDDDIKYALLRVLLDMNEKTKDLGTIIAMNKQWLARIIVSFYESPLESVGQTFEILKTALNELLDKLDEQYIYDYETRSEITGNLTKIAKIERRYTALQSLNTLQVNTAVAEAPARGTEATLVEKRIEEEPTMLRVINAALPGIVYELMKLNRKLVVDNSTLSFSQSISNSLEQFRSSVSTNDRIKASHYIKKMLAAIKKFKNENPKARDLFNSMENDPIQQLESFLGSIGEV
jgi:hypothetical protein